MFCNYLLLWYNELCKRSLHLLHYSKAAMANPQAVCGPFGVPVRPTYDSLQSSTKQWSKTFYFSAETGIFKLQNPT